MLETRGIRLFAALSLSFLVVGNCAVHAAGHELGVCSEFGSAGLSNSAQTYSVFLDGGCGRGVSAASDLVSPSTDSVSFLSSSSSSRLLPPVPRSALMALAGFLCISLVRDGKVWLAVVTGVLSCSFYWLSAGQSTTCQTRARKSSKQQFSVLVDASSESKRFGAFSPTSLRCLNLDAKSEKRPDSPSAVQAVRDLWFALLPSSFSNAELSVLRVSQLTFAQAARGPPLGHLSNVASAFSE